MSGLYALRVGREAQVARVGFEPTACPGLSRTGLPIAYRANTSIRGPPRIVSQVGMAGFEPALSWPQPGGLPRLSYIPI